MTYHKTISMPQLIPPKFFSLHEGSTRWVINIGPLSVKIARPYLLTFLRNISLDFWLCDNHHFAELLRHQIYSFSIDGKGSYKQLLFQGVLANIREFRLWSRTRHPLLMPIFTTTGLINIQQRGFDLQRTNGKALWSYVLNTCIDDYRLAQRDGHALAEDENWKMTPAGIKLVDYGGPAVSRVIMKYGNGILEEVRRGTFIFRALNSPTLTPHQYHVIHQYQNARHSDKPALLEEVKSALRQT